MQAVWIRKHGGSDVLEVRDGPDPEPKPGEVRVRVRACGLNFAEVSARQGLYPDAPKPPCVVGYEGAGIIDSVGAEVSEACQVKEGDRVLYLSRFGGHADVVCVDASQVTVIPDDMSFHEAAAIPVNYLTAYHMLFQVARIRRGDHLLIHMAAGGVGTALLQLARTVEGVVTYGTASATKHDYVRAQGCDHPIDYRSLDYASEVLKLTGGKGVHAIFDALGGKDWKKGYQLLRPAGTLVGFGVSNANRAGKRRLLHVLGVLASAPWFSPLKLMRDNRGVAGVNVGNLWDEREMLKEEIRAVVDFYEQGSVRPHIGGVFPFSRAAAAHEEIEYGRNMGKIILVPDGHFDGG